MLAIDILAIIAFLSNTLLAVFAFLIKKNDNAEASATCMLVVAILDQLQVLFCFSIVKIETQGE